MTYRGSTTPVEGIHYGRDKEGRWVGISKADMWARRRAGKAGKAKSPWRFTSPPTRPKK